jgi:hypothetical protein
MYGDFDDDELKVQWTIENPHLHKSYQYNKEKNIMDERLLMNQLKKGMLVANTYNKEDKGYIEAFDYAHMRVGVRILDEPSYKTLKWFPVTQVSIISKVVYSEAKPLIPEIKDVIYNGPATIIYWVDGTKTVVKCCEHETYDAEKGLAMAICEKAFGDKTIFHQTFKKWVPEPNPEEDTLRIPLLSLEGYTDGPSIGDAFERAGEHIKKIAEALKKM